MPYDNVITRTDAGPLVPEDVAAEILQGVTESSAIMRLGRRLPNMPRNQRRLPVLSALPTAYFVDGDTGRKQTTEISWANVYLDAAEIACIVPVPEAVLDDADYDIWSEVRPLLVEEFGRVFDAAVMYGTNKPSVWPDSLLVKANTASNKLALGGAGGDLYDDIMSEGGLMSKVEADGFAVTGFVGAITMQARLRGLRNAGGDPLFLPNMRQNITAWDLAGVSIIFPKNGSVDAAQSLLIGGDFSKLVYSLRQDITWKILTEAVITDAAGTIIFNLPQQDMVALRAVMRLAWQLPNPINRIEQVAANRCPFGVLTAT